MPYKNVGDDGTGWSWWQWPIHKGYKMSCCDCGLVHEMEFKAVRVVKRYRNGDMMAQPIKSKRVRVLMRGRRDERATAALRREKEKRDGRETVPARRAKGKAAPRARHPRGTENREGAHRAGREVKKPGDSRRRKAR